MVVETLVEVMLVASNHVETRIYYLTEKCHNISPKLINKEQLIICLHMLSIAQNTTTNDTHQARYLRWAYIAYQRALKENSLPLDKDLKQVYGSDLEELM